MAFYLGPLGGMNSFRSPAVGIGIDSTRQGGTHSALSGARTVDFFGTALDYSMKWKHLTEADYSYLVALRDRHIRGPLRLITTGLSRNRLSRSAAAAGFGGIDARGITTTAGQTSYTQAWPADAPPAAGAWSLAWSLWNVGDAVRLDRRYPVPHLADETLTASVYVRSRQGGDAVQLVMDYFGADGWVGSSATTATTLAAGVWTPLELTATPANDRWAVSPALLVTARASETSVLDVAAAQVEVGAERTAWTYGGGAPVVAVDKVPAAITYASFKDAEITLMEV